MKKKKPDHISQEDWDAVDVPEWTDEMFRTARPAHEVFPAVEFPKPRGRGPQKTPTKVQTTIRIDRDLVDHFRRSGRGWQGRLNETLKRAVKNERKSVKS